MKARHLSRLFVWLPAALLALTLLPATSGATVLAPWGSNLQATPTLDTANGATSENGATSTDNGIMPNPHDGADTAVWNSSLASGSPAATQAGQVLHVNVKGCAQKDPQAPTQVATSSGQMVPVNEIHLQTLTPESGGSFKVDQSSQAFTFPFCGDTANGSTVTPNTVTTFDPLHMCIAVGEIVDFNDIGGHILNTNYYPQGVPYQILAPVSGSGMDSYVKDNGTNDGATFSPTDIGSTNGWGSEPNEELLLQVVEGVGDDAYGQCQGGQANEPSDSNAVICVYHNTTPSDPYPTCNPDGLPVRPATNQSPPTITSPSGLYEQGQRLNGVGGTWSSPNSSPWYSWQWEDCSTSGSSCTSISGATNSYYYPTASDVGHTLRVIEYADNDSGYRSPATSAATPVIKASGSGSTSGSGSGSTGGAPVLTHLKLNPAAFPTNLGSTITYHSSESGTTVIRVLNSKGKVVRTITHHDHAGNNGIGHRLSGLRPGRYRLKVVSTYNGHPSRTWTLTFTVRGRRK